MKVGINIRTSNKINFKLKMVIRENVHFAMIKWSINQQYMIINIYTPNIGMARYVNTNTIKRRQNSNIVIEH